MHGGEPRMKREGNRLARCLDERATKADLREVPLLFRFYFRT